MITQCLKKSLFSDLDKTLYLDSFPPYELIAQGKNILKLVDILRSFFCEFY